MKSLIFFVEQFSVEYQKWSWIAFVLLTTLCGWPEKIRSTISNNQMWHENQLAFSRASVRLPVSEPVLWLVVVILRFWFLRRSFENLLWMRWLTKTDKIQILVIKIDIFSIGSFVVNNLLFCLFLTGIARWITAAHRKDKLLSYGSWRLFRRSQLWAQ